MRWTRLDATDLIAAVSALLSVGLYFYTRKSGRSPQFILDLVLVYMVLTGLALGLFSHSAGWPSNMPIFPVISWIGVGGLMFDAIVPYSSYMSVVAGLSAASMYYLA